MSDHIIRGMAANNQVRFFAGTTRDIVRLQNLSTTQALWLQPHLEDCSQQEHLWEQCKNESDVLTLQIQCNGPDRRTYRNCRRTFKSQGICQQSKRYPSRKMTRVSWMLPRHLISACFQLSRISVSRSLMSAVHSSYPVRLPRI